MRSNQRGFTIIELMITILVLAVLVAVAAPSFTRQIQNNRVLAIADELQGAFALARSEAIKRAAAVSVCASTDGLECGANWNDGFIVFVDGTLSGAGTPVVDEVLQVWSAPDGAPQFVADQAFVRFVATGVNASGALRFDVYFEGCTGSEAARRIVVGPSGMTTVSRLDCP